MKKSSKKETKKFSIKSLILKKGFYIALLTMIMVIGTVAVVRKFTANISTATSSFDDEAGESAIAQAKEESETVFEESADDSALYDDILKDLEDDFSESETDEPDLSAEETVPTVAEKAPEVQLSFLMPCSGSIIRSTPPISLYTQKPWTTGEPTQGLTFLPKKIPWLQPRRAELLRMFTKMTI